MTLDAARAAAAPLVHRPAEPALSVVVPAHDEAEALPGLIGEIADALAGTPFEIVVVDDGSRDRTAEVLASIARRQPALRVVRHARAAGQSAAVRSGLLAARAPVVVTIDGDGQNDPAYIPALVARLEAGGPRVGLAAGQRTARKDGTAKSLASRFANGLRGRILRDGTRDSGCGLKALRRAVFLRLPFFDGWHRFLPALVIREGYAVVHLDVVDRPRRFGRSKYGILDRGLRGALDLFGVWWLIRRTRPVEVAPAEIGAGEGE
jgi:dolichol-phosphate mannosyltransferase